MTLSLEPWRFLLPKTMHHKQTPEKLDVFTFLVERGERMTVKREEREMARRNQLDMGCSEAHTFRRGLIGDLEVDSTRVLLLPKTKSPHTPYPTLKINWFGC